MVWTKALFVVSGRQYPWFSVTWLQSPLFKLRISGTRGLCPEWRGGGVFVRKLGGFIADDPAVYLFT